MGNTLKASIKLTAIILFLGIAYAGCKKQLSLSETITNEQFFKLPANADSDLRQTVESLKKELPNNEAINNFLSWHGQPLWGNILKIKTDNQSFKFYIPTKKQNQGFIASFIVAKYFKGKFYFELHRRNAILSNTPEPTYVNIDRVKTIELLSYFDSKVLHIYKGLLSQVYEKELARQKSLLSKSTVNTTTPSTLSGICYDYFCLTGGEGDGPINSAAPRKEPRLPPMCTYCFPPDGPTPGGGGGGGGGAPPPTGGGGGSTPTTPSPPSGPAPCNPFAGGLWYSFVPPIDPCAPATPPTQAQLDLQWMNNNIKDSTNNPCVASTLATLKSISSKLPKLIRDYFDSSSTLHFKFKQYFDNNPSCNGNSNCEPEGGYTDPIPKNDTFSIYLNSYYNNSTDLSIAATMIHETLHAQLVYWLRKALIQGDTTAQNQLAARFGYVFTPDFANLGNLYNKALEGTTQHDAMVNSYMDIVSEALYQFAIAKDINVSLANCKSLAWAGLNNTEGFRKLSLTNQDYITNMINAERDPYGNTINGSGGVAQERHYGHPCN